MFKYEITGPDYQPFPYEETLARAELASLTKGVPISEDVIETSVQAEPEVLRRVAFSASVIGEDTNVMSDVTLLERVTRTLTNGGGTRKESHYLTHGLHRFKGKFYPQLARALLNTAMVEPGDLVLDPFAGSGTSLVESWLLGADGIGFDVNPLSQLIAETKVRLLDEPAHSMLAGLDCFEHKLALAAKREGFAWQDCRDKEPSGRIDYPASELAAICNAPTGEKELYRWFPGSVRHKLAVVLRVLRDIDDQLVRDFLRICLSDQIRSCSQQDPRDLRTRRRREPIDDAPVFTTLLLKARRELEKLEVGQQLTDRYPWQSPRVSVELQDTRHLRPDTHHLLSARAVDAVVTSPPYATALPYVDTERLSFLVLGLLSRAERSTLEREMIGSREVTNYERLCIEDEMESSGLQEMPSSIERDLREVLETNRNFKVGFRRRDYAALLYRYFVGMQRSLSNIAETMRVGALAFLVLGDSKTILGDGRSFTVTTCDHVTELAEQVGLSWEDSIPITVTTQGLAHARNAITENRVVVLRKRA